MEGKKKNTLTKVILVVPLDANSEIIVLVGSTEEIIETEALAPSQTVNMLDMVTNSKDGLPASYWAHADNGGPRWRTYY